MRYKDPKLNTIPDGIHIAQHETHTRWVFPAEVAAVNDMNRHTFSIQNGACDIQTQAAYLEVIRQSAVARRGDHPQPKMATCWHARCLARRQEGHLPATS